MSDITIKSLFREDLQRFKMPREGATLAGVRSKLETQHRGMLPQNFVIKYEWGTSLHTAAAVVVAPAVPASTEALT